MSGAVGWVSWHSDDTRWTAHAGVGAMVPLWRVGGGTDDGCDTSAPGWGVVLYVLLTAAFSAAAALATAQGEPGAALGLVAAAAAIAFGAWHCTTTAHRRLDDLVAAFGSPCGNGWAPPGLWWDWSQGTPT